MSSSKEHNNSADFFSDYMKKRLENHTTPVDPSLWETIDSAVQKREKGLWSRIIPFIAAAALLSFAVWIFFSNDKDMHTTETISSVVTDSVPSLQKHTPEGKEYTPVLPVKEFTARVQPSVKKNIAPPHIEEIDIPPTTPEEKINKEDNSSEKSSDENKKEIEQQTPKEKPIFFDKGVTQTLSDSRKDMESLKTQKQKRIMLAAAVGTSQNQSFLHINGEPPLDYNEGSQNPNPPLPPYINYPVDYEDYADFKYSLPLSFGLSIRYSLHKNWAVETGLVYTYLSTKMSGYKNLSIDGELALHYLGIPVNLVANLWQQSRWNIYISGGFMIEKGLVSSYTQKTRHMDQTYTFTNRKSIQGIQWSLNGALGFAYLLDSNWGLYIEPKVFYYFDNNQPISNRTDNPFGIGINGGIRYLF